MSSFIKIPYTIADFKPFYPELTDEQLEAVFSRFQHEFIDSQLDCIYDGKDYEMPTFEEMKAEFAYCVDLESDE